MTQLTTRNAQVTTATVEIQTLTVSGRQVTLSLFRQLPHKRLVSDNGELNGQPWGTVNYHPDKCGDYTDHLHVVWQDGEQLCRSSVQHPIPFYSFSRDSVSELAQALYCLNGHQDIPAFKREWAGGIHIRFELDGALCIASRVPEDCPSRTYLDSLVSYGPTQPACRTEADRDKALVQVCEEIADERAWCDRHLATWQTLTGLPQLFIAT